MHLSWLFAWLQVSIIRIKV
ncbi:hypothetical protein C5167_044428 [Papaver somniferum]|uniref:Uncharacterized protein n=1 Tax=Papaver somniferum TaxID=3469 RepID=A0A4Y7LCD4_PAPSO|nr:hypothetical protein C5167_044428 [Papaver somniferum]